MGENTLLAILGATFFIAGAAVTITWMITDAMKACQ